MARGLGRVMERSRLLLAGGVLIAVLLCVGGQAHASVGWSLNVLRQPSVFTAKDEVECEATRNRSFHKCDRLSLVGLNVGDDRSAGPVTVTVSVSRGAIQFGEIKSQSGNGPEEVEREWECSEGAGPGVAVCRFEEAVEPGNYTPGLIVPVTAPSGTETGVEDAHVTIDGGGAAGVAETTIPTPLNLGPPTFGISEFGFTPEAAGGERESHAGGHPWALTTALGVPGIFSPEVSPGSAANSKPYGAVETLRNIGVEVPFGFVGMPRAAAQCTESELAEGSCGADSRVGVVTVGGGQLFGSYPGFTEERGGLASAVYNMVPERGYAAEFAFTFAHKYHVYLYATLVHTASGYRARITAPDVPSAPEATNVWLTLFGEPGALKVNGSESSEAFLSNPTGCAGGSESARAEADSWQEPGRVVEASAVAYPELSGCDVLGFEPKLEFAPSVGGEGVEAGSSQVDSPSAFTGVLKLPLTTGFEQAATPPLKNAVVTLPAGVSINPAAGQGLVGCQAEGPEGINIGSGSIGAWGQDLGDSEATELGAGHPGGNGSRYDDGFFHIAKGHCPAASTIGTAKIVSPLLSEPLEGHLYIAEPKCGGAGQAACSEASATNGELYGAYLEAEAPEAGAIVKIASELHADPHTGQLTVVFTESPQFPVSEVRLNVQGGQRAPLANPQACGAAQTSAALEPWSGGVVPAGWEYPVTGCPASTPFTPGFTAGSTNLTAGSTSPFELTLSRVDGEGDVGGLSAVLPSGMAARLSSVPLCGEAQANAGSCGGESEIGTVAVGVGVGSEPLMVSGRVFLTGPYHGAPFGLSIAVPAVAGPFNLGVEVVRARILINPVTAQATVISDAIPQIRDGVPLRLHSLHVEIDRAGGFVINPTHCSPQAITATATSTGGASAALSVPFAVTGCKGLAFHPSFQASTDGRTSKKGGASLKINIAQAPGQANIKSVDTQLPIQLPARGSTLEKACTEAQFNANPAGCPAGSLVGSATAVTPILSSPLMGPAYLVSHGGAAFPDLEFVLQGANITIILDGKTDIKKGITYSRFETVPDAPVTSFEASLPEGYNSLLADFGSLCKPTTTVTVTKRVTRRVKGHLRHVTIKVKKTVATPLTLPTIMTGQNGVVVKQTTPLKAVNCPKPPKKPHTKAKKKHK